MKTVATIMGALALSLGLTAAHAAEPAKQQVAAAPESFDQKCGRWADYQGLKDKDRAEYVQDCVRELRFPDKPAAGGDGD